MKKFHSYVFGHHFLLYTDHKPLLVLLSEHCSTSPQTSARIRRWSLSLAAYEYTLKCRGTLSHSNADALSQLPLPVAPVESDLPPEVILLQDHIAESPVTDQQIRAGTCKDPLMATVLQYVWRCWPTSSSIREELSPYSSRKAELSLQDGCLLWPDHVLLSLPQSARMFLQSLMKPTQVWCT